MSTLNISMPKEMRQYIELKVNAGAYQSASDYMRDLIRHERQETEKLLLDGLGSGEPRPLDMKKIRSMAKRQLAKEGKR